MTPEDLVALYRDRLAVAGPRLTRAREVRDAVNGDLAIPLPEMDENEKPMVANLIDVAQAQIGMRVSSVMPDITCPPTKEGSKRAEKKAADRRRAMLGWWEAEAYDLIAERRARHYFAYAATPVMIRPDPKTKAPRCVILDPLGTFCAETTNPDDVEPDDAVRAYDRSWGWLRRTYPETAARLRRPSLMNDTERLTLLEYVDADQHLLVVLGPGRRDAGSTSWDASGRLVLPSGSALNGTNEIEKLVDVPNRAGVCTVVQAGRVCLDRPVGAFDGTVGLYQNQAMLLALHAIGVRRDVFPDEWLVSRPNETARIVTQADGVRGVTGVVEGGDIKSEHHPPGFGTEPLLNYLERGIRMDAGLPADLTGQSATNVRTARRGDAILSATVDFTVQAAHKVLARSASAENRRRVAVAKAYYGSIPKSFYVSWKGARGQLDYTPDDLFDTDENVVSYAAPGSDSQTLIVGLGQRVSLEMMSRLSAARMDPMIDDAEFEHDRVQYEALERGVLADFQQPSPDPRMLLIKARVMELVRSNKMELTEAIAKVQQEEQQRQASNGPPGTPTGPVPPGSPEAQPGIAPPGAGAEAPVAPPGAGVTNLADLLSRLHRPEVIARAG